MKNIFKILIFAVVTVLAVFFIDLFKENKNLKLDNNYMIESLTALNDSCYNYQQSIKDKDSKIAILEEENGRYKLIIADKDFEIEVKNETIKTLQTDKQNLLTELEQKTTELEEKNNQVAGLQADKDNLQLEVTNLQNQLNEQKNLTEQQRVEFQNQIDSKNVTITELQEEIIEKQITISNLETDKRNLQNEIELKNQEIQNQTTQIEILENDKQSLQNQISVNQQTISTLQSEKQDLQNRLDSAQNQIYELEQQLGKYKQYVVLINDTSIVDSITVTDMNTQTSYKLSNKDSISGIVFYSWQDVSIFFMSDVRVAVDGVEIDSNMMFDICGSERIGTTIVIKNIANAGVLDFSRVRVNAPFNCSSNSSYSFNDTLTITNDNGVYTVYEEGSQQYCPVKNVDITNGTITYEIQKKVSITTVTVPCTLDFINMTTSATAKASFLTVDWTGQMNLLEKLY